MSRYIDADEIGNAKFQEENLRGMGEHIAYRIGWNEAIESILENAPSIDICFCKECKHKDEIVNYCYENDRDVNADDFCSYGEREGE